MGTEIAPRLLKGFRDTLPTPELVRERLLERIRHTFRQSGFQPIDTPILEYSDILLGNGGDESDKQLYRFTDQGGRDVAMRYDLTVPFARFVVQHAAQLTMPFRRYQIGKVFRGENPQRGRFREFIQCDFDIVGSSDAISDYDALRLPLTVLSTLIPPERLVLRLSHRDLLLRFVQARAAIAPYLADMRIIIDKIHKIGEAAVEEQLGTLLGGGHAQYRAEIMALLRLAIHPTDGAAAMERLGHILTGNKTAAPEPLLLQLQTLITLLHTHNQVEIVLDPSIMRGLSYYTGVIFEIYDRSTPTVGAIAAGGRYDTLTARYRGGNVPAVGGSIGIDRLLAIPDIAAAAGTADGVQALIFYEREPLLIAGTDRRAEKLIEAAAYLRKRGVAVEIYPQPAKLQRQFGYAAEKNIKYGIITTHYGENSVQYELKNLATKTRRECPNVSALYDCLKRTE